MRSASRFALVLALPIAFACGGDDDGDDDGSNTTVPTTSADDDGGSGDTAADDDGNDDAPADSSGGDDSPADSSGGAGGGPTIESVTWTNVAGCTPGVGSDVTVAIVVTDPDNDPSEITLSGMAIGCTGMFDMPMVTLTCPNAATYNGSVTATDPDGNEDEVDIAIEPCVDGSAP